MREPISNSAWGGPLTICDREEQTEIRKSLESLCTMDFVERARYINIQEVLKKIESLHEELVQVRMDGLAGRSEPSYSKINRLLEQSVKYAGAASELQKEQQILDSLRFPGMTAREDNIADAEPSTFSWVFDELKAPTSHPSVTRLANWLCSADKIFWISGKPGSGKSTLMRHIYHHPNTRNRLRLWAQKSELIMSSFYFWYAGTEMQKSRKGLFQSLLHKILSENPKLIPQLCPDQWEKLGARSSAPDAASWSLKELTASFQKLNDVPSPQNRFCFFIDGLDEYKGDQDQFEIVEIIQELSSSPHIKLCLASRPWTMFEDAFGSGKDESNKLYLQDLTKSDINRYTRNKLAPHIRCLRSEDESTQFQQLIHEVVKKSQGVFLWVVLVVRSLREGLSNGDDIRMLQLRLNSLPTELERFFQLIIDSVETFYKEIMAKTFLIALGTVGVALADSQRGPLLLEFSFLDEMDPDFALLLPTAPLSDTEISIRHDQMKRRLNGRYKGLLEVWDTERNSPLAYRYTVQWLHRTVRDFLATGGMQNFLMSYISPDFGLHFALGRVFLAKVKTQLTSSAPLDLERKIFELAKITEAETGKCDFLMLDELERTMENRHSTSFSLAKSSVLGDLKSYVIYRLRKDERWRRPPKEKSLLEYMLNEVYSETHFEDRAGMTKCLLENGADPNWDRTGTPPWLYLFQNLEYRMEYKPFDEFLDLLDLLLKKGVDVRQLMVSRELVGSYFSSFLLPALTTYSLEIVDQRWNPPIILEKLFQYGLRPSKRYDFMTWEQIVHAILSASKLGGFAFDTVRICLRYGAKPSLPGFETILSGNYFLGRTVELRRLVDVRHQAHNPREEASTSRTTTKRPRMSNSHNETTIGSTAELGNQGGNSTAETGAGKRKRNRQSQRRRQKRRRDEKQ